MKRILMVTLSLFIAGCASVGTSYNQQAVLELELMEPITVPAGRSFVYIKAPGQVVSRAEISSYDVYCKLSIPRSKSSGELVLNPDKFIAGQAYRRISGGYTYPQNSLIESQTQVAGLFRHHDASREDLELVMSLSSINQPQVKSLSCVRFGDPYFDRAPSINEAKQVLEGLFVLTTN